MKRRTVIAGLLAMSVAACAEITDPEGWRCDIGIIAADNTRGVASASAPTMDEALQAARVKACSQLNLDSAGLAACQQGRSVGFQHIGWHCYGPGVTVLGGGG